MDVESKREEYQKSHASVTQGGSLLSRYQSTVVGRHSLMTTVYYEWCVFLALVPGAIGLFLRKLFWPRLFGTCGKGVVFGRNIVIRHPNRIHLGDRVVISEGCILDARNYETDRVLVIGDDGILSNNVMISCKKGTATIGMRAGIGAQTIIHSTSDCPVEIGDDVMIGPFCYIVGGGQYNIDRLDIPMNKQGIRMDGGVKLENDIWLGAHVTILGGVTMETGCVAAAGAVITKSVSAHTICGGIPAKFLKKRVGAVSTESE